MSLGVADIFAGAGGLSLGLVAAGFEIVLGVEQNRDAAESFAKAHPSAEVLQTDIASVVWSDWKSAIDVLVGGPPCQPWSVGGKHLGAEDPRDGWPQFLRALDELQPKAFLAENVPGFARSPRSEIVVKEMEAFGYAVSTQILDAADYGAPQHRRRFFIVGTRDCKFTFPVPTHGPSTSQPWRTAGDVLTLEPFGDANTVPVTYARNPDIRSSPYTGHLWNGGGRPIDLTRPARTLLADGSNRLPWVDTLGIAPEYYAHLRAGGTPRSGTVPGARRITLEEAAALQGFSLSMFFAGCRSSQYRQVGNAVPPPLAEAVGRALLATLGAEPCAKL